MKQELSIQTIQKHIFIIRGYKVILDKMLAELYGVETRALNQAVQRNLKRFPDDFMFELNREEVGRISQFVISLKFSKRIWAFTEQGVAMLSGILNSPRAIETNLAIMRTFVQLRQMALTHKDLAEKISVKFGTFLKVPGSNGKTIGVSPHTGTDSAQVDFFLPSFKRTTFPFFQITGSMPAFL